MLQTIDILLGLTVIMLVVSMAVTVLTQFVTTVFNTRGRHLLQGLADLLQQVDPTMSRKIAEGICGAILSHPMVRDVGPRYGSTIHREEFTKLLMDLASGQAPNHSLDRLEEDARRILLETLKENGIADPKTTLDKVRDLALRLEIENPELASHARHAKALMQEAHSRLVAKINGWFDQTIDRVSDRFTFTTRGITFVCSLVVAITIQLDTVTLINRLSVDTQLRNALVEKAYALGNEQALQPAISVNLSPQQRQDIQDLAQLRIIDIPGSPAEWWAHWKQVNGMGVLLSVFLLSLGAPFWYGALKNLLKLRGTLASKDDDQRYERQSTQQTGGAGSTASPADT